ncbi:MULTISPECIES: nuclear transport factor 2 family protein [Pandoraea]|uniref:Polyketide cyclase n=1 Tax=Pandoraea communis TaxID=2508297 RepID=A0A5E4XUM9_9BURK|nr:MULTISPECIES: nuclear transport factor 2 family protein [Pandoraea]ALS66633.1 polyketide cyclase [Pandoraea apista]CFB61385.1 hypothetical protein LMG16407_01444 [Pandoraea apista]VVE40036.1 polyketide cyclase [Pandoraea communis]
MDAMMKRLAVLEAEHAVRRTMARYMALCDVPNGGVEGETLKDLFASDAIWQGIGPHYANKFGYLQGHEQIIGMLNRYHPPVPHFTLNVHFLTTETIEVNPDAEFAKGRWIMLQTSAYVAGNSELIGAKLEIDFKPSVDGTWLIQHFRTQRLFDAPAQLNPAVQLDHAAQQ